MTLKTKKKKKKALLIPKESSSFTTLAVGDSMKTILVEHLAANTLSYPKVILCSENQHQLLAWLHTSY